MLPTQSNRDAGFTLIELSIVLIIIGLLIGGVLQGQEMINNTRIKTTGYINYVKKDGLILFGLCIVNDVKGKACRRSSCRYNHRIRITTRGDKGIIFIHYRST